MFNHGTFTDDKSFLGNSDHPLSSCYGSALIWDEPVLVKHNLGRVAFTHLSGGCSSQKSQACLAQHIPLLTKTFLTVLFVPLAQTRNISVQAEWCVRERRFQPRDNTDRATSVPWESCWWKRESHMRELLFVAIQNNVADYLIWGSVGQACFPSVQDKRGCRESVFCITPHRVYLGKKHQDWAADAQSMVGGEKPCTMIP